MHLPDPALVVALLTLVAAGAAAVVADQPPAPAGRRCRYPVIVIGVALTNIVLTVIVFVRPEPVTGVILLAAALLLMYGAHRRARLTMRPSPRHDRRPPP